VLFLAIGIQRKPILLNPVSGWVPSRFGPTASALSLTNDRKQIGLNGIAQFEIKVKQVVLA